MTSGYRLRQQFDFPWKTISLFSFHRHPHLFHIPEDFLNCSQDPLVVSENENPNQIKESWDSGMYLIFTVACYVRSTDFFIAVQSPAVLELMNKILNATKDYLFSVLRSVESWKWPRSDLNAWSNVLNKFDSILEDIIIQYELERVQTISFPAETKLLVSEILRFQRLLLENSTNRKTFSSYDVLSTTIIISSIVLISSL